MRYLQRCEKYRTDVLLLGTYILKRILKRQWRVLGHDNDVREVFTIASLSRKSIRTDVLLLGKHILKSTLYSDLI
jgi:hypothetical protein